MMKKTSMSGWPNGAACGLDRDRLLDGFFVAGMHRRQFFHLQNMHTEVADLAQGQPGELRDCLADAAKNIIHRRKRSEEHTSELQSLRHLVCRLLLEQKKRRDN